MRILVFGGRGFVGRPLVKRLCDEGHEVGIVDSGAIRSEGEIDERVTWRTSGDVREASTIADSLALVRPEAIYWLPAVQGYTSPRRLFYEVNVAPAVLLLDEIEKWREWRTLKRIVLASSEAVYTPGNLVPEMWGKQPFSDYGMSKLMQEQAFFHLGRTLNMPVVALRYSIILGGGQSLQETESGILRNWYSNWSRGLPCEIYGDGEQIRSFVHVDDVTDANVKALDCELPFDKQEAINISGYARSVNQMAEIFKEAAEGSTFEVTNQDFRPGGEYSLSSLPVRATELLKWHAEKDPECMIKDFLKGLDKPAAVG
jgi:nucleoside-diphosphate-sugar epimerase